MSAAEPIGDTELGPLFAPLQPFDRLILAVSGGADSMAMMHLVNRWARRQRDRPRALLVATVDHGLRRDSREEATWVAQEAQAIGLKHALLVWEGPKPQTGLQDAARGARYRLLTELALRLGSSGAIAIVTAHTEDDQAETLLMRLARGSGLDGLTGMSAQRMIGLEADVRLVRPLLGVAGARLEATLRAGKQSWIDDPSNNCDQFERVRLRKAMGPLASIGLTSPKIALSARRLERAREALEAAAAALQSAAGLDVHAGAFAGFDARVFQEAPEEVRLRLLARLIAAFGGQDEPVRLARLEALLARLGAPGFEAATLGGCIVALHGDEIRIARERGRVELPQLELAPGMVAVWDRRFKVAAAAALDAPVIVRALGATAFARLRRQLKGGRALPPARAAATLPSFWQRGTLLTVPPLATLPGAPAAWTSGKSRHCSAEFLW